MAGRRSASWFGATGKLGAIHRSWMKTEGVPDDVFEGRAVIGIANSWSELTPCNLHLRRVAEAVKRGVWEAGGFPVEFPTISLGETLMRPSTMLFRNLMAMEVEECIRANPVDGVVLLAGCDKTVPGQLMGAVSVDLPSILITGGPKLNGKFQGQDVGSGTSVWRFSEAVRAGEMSAQDFLDLEICMSRSEGHCMTMGTASTMASVTEALGMQMPGSSSIPAVDARRLVSAHEAGRRIVQMVEEGLSPSQILTRDAFENAIRVNAAIGGSTNAVIHLLAIAGRVGVSLSLDDFDELARDVPLLVNMMPSGRFLMEDFYYAGGLPVVMKELGDLLHRDAITVSGRALGEGYADATCWNPEVIGTMEEPVQPAGSGTAVLRGNLAPDGAIIKQSAASPNLLKHRGPAVVFDSIEDYDTASEDPDLDVDEDSVIVVRNAGPVGYPGMPEVGNVGLPRRLLERGVTDMVRISDARMSGTSYGTVVLHVAPEAAVGGPLALVQTGDMVELDVPARVLRIDVPDDELERRRATWEPPASTDRGYVRMYREHVMQADRGADLDFLVGSSGHEVPRRPF
jgi:L-arabonate dehydrase